MKTFFDMLPDISVETASVPIALDGVIARGVLWQASNGRFMLNVPGVARYLVEAGRVVTIDPAPNTPAHVVEHHLRMLPMAALIYQRGLLAFHAAAVSKGEVSLLLAGDSGSGKSTLLAELSRRGWQVLADDLVIAGLDGDGQPTVYPVHPGILLWPDSLEKLGIAKASLTCVDASRYEYYPPVLQAVSPQQLRGIYRLTVHNKPDVEIKEIAVGARFQMTGTMLYNSHVADVVCNRGEYLRCVAAVVQSVAYRDLRRPRGVNSVEALADMISI